MEKVICVKFMPFIIYLLYFMRKSHFFLQNPMGKSVKLMYTELCRMKLNEKNKRIINGNRTNERPMCKKKVVNYQKFI